MGHLCKYVAQFIFFLSEGTLHCTSEVSKKPVLSTIQFGILKHIPENEDFSSPKQLILLFPYC